MKDDFLRVRISEDLYKRYKILCIKKNLSIPLQTNALIKNFVDIQEDNEKKIEEAKNRKI
jgi:hypothetical protein